MLRTDRLLFFEIETVVKNKIEKMPVAGNSGKDVYSQRLEAQQHLNEPIAVVPIVTVKGVQIGAVQEHGQESDEQESASEKLFPVHIITPQRLYEVGPSVLYR